MTKTRSPRYVDTQVLADALKRANLDAVVVQSAKNVWYLSGHPRVGSSQRPGGPGAALTVATKDGNTILVAGRWHSGLAGRVSWSSEVVKFRNFAESGFHAVANVLEAEGLASGRIGVEMDYVSENDFWHLTGALPEAEFVDAGNVINELRIRKSPPELKATVAAFEQLGRAMMHGLEQARVGDSHIQIHNRIMKAILQQGTDTGRGGIGFPGDTIVPLVSTDKTARTSAGDVLTLDYTCSFGAYAARLNRTVFVGEVPPAITERYKKQHDTLAQCVESITATSSAEQAATTVGEVLTSAGFRLAHPIVGHGISLGYEDAPILGVKSRDILAPGMDFVLAPTLIDGYAMSKHVMVTSSGCEILASNYDTAAAYAISK